ncbi:MAG: hypothetical protein O2960_00675 [Verrucomicrobia bacterium]|nr:hypothetical protein [Verrucomicrobiota bacterium]
MASSSNHQNTQAASATYDLEVNYLDDKNDALQFELTVNGVIQGQPWKSTGTSKGWVIHTIRGLSIKTGDEITVSASGGPAQIDYVQLNAQRSTAQSTRAIDPKIRVVTWLLIVPHRDDLAQQHAEYLSFYARSSAGFIVMRNETFHHSKKGATSRKTLNQ